MSWLKLIRQPSAFLPVAMSLAALIMTVSYLAAFGVVHEADENTPAHIFQLLMGGQLPIVAYFAIKWLPQAPRQAMIVLTVQAAAGLAALAPVFYFQL